MTVVPKQKLRPALRRIYYEIGSRKILRPVLRPWREPIAILCFHRVMPTEALGPDPDRHPIQAMPLDLFEALAEELAGRHRVVSMDEAAERFLARDREPVVAITFDDGYKDNLDYALPVLKKHRIPATIYITTRFPEGDGRMWWADLRDAVMTRDRIEIDDAGGRRVWTTRSSAERAACLADLRSIILGQTSEVRERILAQALGDRAGVDRMSDCLSWSDIEALAREHLITIGAHTHTHPCLKLLTEAEVLEEMRICRDLLESRLGRPVRHFAYPGGDPEWIGEREFRLARDFGWKTSVTLMPRLAAPTLHRLPRMLVVEYMTVPMLRAYLAGWKNFWDRSSAFSPTGKEDGKSDA